MKFVIHHANNIEKYIDRLVKYTRNIDVIVDMVLDKLMSTACDRVVIEINGIGNRACVFDVICNALGIECKDEYGILKIRIKNIENLSTTLSRVLYGFKIAEQFKVYGIGSDVEMMIHVCDETITLDVEVE